MNKLRQNKAITLIALVITIIVLLILAAVTLNFVLGENGIIAKAKEAKEKTLISQYEEQINLKKLELKAVKDGAELTLAEIQTGLNTLDFVNKTEIKNNAIELTTNDSYVFNVTENATAYISHNGVVANTTIYAKDVEFDGSSWTGGTNIDNVEKALNYLYANI